MPATGVVTMRPGKRWKDDTERLAPAALDQTGMPVFTLGADSIGTAEMITAEILAVLQDQSSGLQTTFVFPNDVSLANKFLLPLGDITVVGADLSFPVAIQQSQAATLLPVWFLARVSAKDNVKIFGIQQTGAPVVIPSGTTLKLSVYSFHFTL